MAGKSAVTMKEILCLVQCGYPEGALSFEIDRTDWKRRLYDLLIYYNSLLEGDENV